MTKSSTDADLWQGFLDLRTLDAAWEKVRANAGASGGDGVTIGAYQVRAARRLAELAQDLANDRYAPAPCRSVDIPKKKGGTRRLVIPSVEDRVVHTALALVLGPVLEPQFEDASFAYRPGRSVQQAVQAIARWRDQGYWHVIEADIVGFFDAVRHDALLVKLEAALDGMPGALPVIDLVAFILEHQSLQTGGHGRGLAQGSPLSPLLSNLYLDALDEEIAGRGIRLVRFADDFVVLCKKRATAEDALREVAEVLEAHGLELHEGGTRVVDFDRGFQFLGHLFVRSFVLQQVSDPEEDAVSLLRRVGEEDASLTREVEAEVRGGYDRGDRVLYVTEPGRRVGLRNQSFAVLDDGGNEIAGIAHGRVDRIEVGPSASVDFAVLDHALATETEVALVDWTGCLRGQLSAPVAGRGELHLQQAAAVLDPAQSVEVARALVDARIRNQRTQLFRLNRRQEKAEVTAALARMGGHLRKVPHQKTVEELRGMEGVCGAEYWPALGLLTKGCPVPLRRSRPARDAMNVAVNYLAAILERDVRAAVLAAGLHPGFGVLHAPRDRHEAGVYDLMEPFRAPLTEGLASFLFNANRLRAEMFTSGRRGVRMAPEARRALITGYEQAVAKRVNAPGRTVRLAWRPMMRRQAQDLAAALRRGAASEFRPYLMEA